MKKEKKIKKLNQKSIKNWEKAKKSYWFTNLLQVIKTSYICMCNIGKTDIFQKSATFILLRRSLCSHNKQCRDGPQLAHGASCQVSGRLGRIIGPARHLWTNSTDGYITALLTNVNCEQTSSICLKVIHFWVLWTFFIWNFSTKNGSIHNRFVSSTKYSLAQFLAKLWATKVGGQNSSPSFTRQHDYAREYIQRRGLLVKEDTKCRRFYSYLFCF